MTLHAEQDVVELVYSLRQQNADLVAALEEIKKGEGPYSQDKLTHADNTIFHLVLIATQALAKVGK
jgi:hypothetical protein